MKKIFVPTDFSPCAMSAFESAIKLAKHYAAQIHLVHGFNATPEMITTDYMSPFQGIPGTISAEQIQNYLRELREEIHGSMENWCQKAAAFEVECHPHIIDFAQYNELNNQAETLGCDLIVMGSKGKSGVGNFILGSYAQKFVRYSKLPVMIIKPDEPLEVIDRVLFSSTFSQEGETEHYHQFRKIFNLHLPHVHFLYVNTLNDFQPSKVIDNRISEFTHNTWATHYSTHVYNDYSLEQGIMNFIESQPVNMVILLTHNYNSIQRLLHPSQSEHLLNHLKVPVLIFRIEE